jgi:signal transduction histidine kinase/DNA-binding NarL/FixJ family response regulator
MSDMQPWQLCILSVVLSLIVTSAMSLLFHGRVTWDYLATGFVASLFVSYIIIRLASFYRSELIKRVEERTAELLQARREVDRAHIHAQRMEAIGQLTGGVAHDFNNLLAVILGRLHLLDEELAINPELRGWVQSSIRAAERAADLTKSLLSFARQQALKPVALDLNEVVGDLEELLHRALGEAYQFRLVTGPGLWTVEADPGQLQNALVNLVLNARDAMPNGGMVTIATSNMTLTDESIRRQGEARPGDYVVISVSDTGTGMPREVIERAFEPFFTTKDVGKGSGLGLSMVYGFVNQSGGHVAIESELGHGTTVRIAMPRKIGADVTVLRDLSPERRPPRGSETILVVEDDDELRVLTRLQLERLGYTVLEAEHGAEGLRVIKENPGVALLVTDLVMPLGMSGLELAEQATALRPSLKAVFMSGYSDDDEVLKRRQRDLPKRFLQKPFNLGQLAAEIRVALD